MTNRAAGLIICLSLTISAVGLIWLERQPSSQAEPTITQSMALRPTTQSDQSKPTTPESDEINQLADRAGFSSRGRQLFINANPQFVDSIDKLQQRCRQPLKAENPQVIFGCHIDNSYHQTIYILTSSCAGFEEMIAGHEMLHHAYQALSGPEKKDLIDQLLAFGQTNPDLKDRLLVDYRNQDQAIQLNELHSILGSQIIDLPTELEDHYATYYLNRSQSLINNLWLTKNRNLKEEITIGQLQLTALSAELDREEEQLQQIVGQLELEPADDQIKIDIDQTRQAIEDYNRRIDDYQAKSQALQTAIDYYNQEHLQGRCQTQ